ncbi:hypothetical protein [Burkholderia ubonensis]|uniref:hypothetical protein n=1 Tax=Burkholderia ubonensis TaxID=101571 RepID=UPI001E637557|nr:hypothetical protein [Burkholderia ubonensis]
MKPNAVGRSVAMCRAWLNACSAVEEAREVCSKPAMLEMTAFLERVSTSLWSHGSNSCNLAAIHAQQISLLLLESPAPSGMSRAVLASELEGAALDLGDALDSAGRSHSDPVVKQVDIITELLWSRGDDKHARAAVRLQRIAVTLIQSGVNV